MPAEPVDPAMSDGDVTRPGEGVDATGASGGISIISTTKYLALGFNLFEYITGRVTRSHTTCGDVLDQAAHLMRMTGVQSELGTRTTQQAVQFGGYPRCGPRGPNEQRR